jgi:mannose-6-phosphate isomerase-like protein (cupin superfamily)
LDLFDIRAMLAERDDRTHTYAEFFRAGTLSLGLSVRPAGLPDEQQPHAEDEVYYVIAGRGRFRIGPEDEAVGPGSVIFVPAGAVHQFHTIAESLHVLVFWAPPHRSRERRDERS